jgi:TolA-binding protein
MPCPIAKLAAGFLACALISLSADGAHADDVDEALQKLIRLDQHVHIMALEFNEAPLESADLPDRRVLDAQVLLGLGRTDEATTLLLATIARWPRTLAARDATFELGDALFEQQEFLSARPYYEKAVSTFTGTKREQRALVHLIEIALHTGDFEHVDEYLGLLATRSDAALDPAVAYVKAKVLYYRGNLDEANRILASMPPASAYSRRARYFIGTIMVKRGDLTGAAKAYEGLLETPAPDDDAREIQDLARLALGRISYERGQTERAIIYYQSISAHSKVLGDGLYELGWTYVRAKDFAQAEGAFGRLLRFQPDGPQAPELKLLVANLHLRQGDLELAQGAFSRARDELEPAYRKLRAVITRSQADPVFLEILASRNLDELDLATFVPASARNWVRSDPEVERLLTLAHGVVDAQKGVADVTSTFERILGVLADVDRLGHLALFPDLKRARQGSTEARLELVEVRGQFAPRVRRLVQPYLLEAEGQLLDRNAAEHATIEQQLGSGLPTAQSAPIAGFTSAESDDGRAPSSTLVSSDSPDPVGQLLSAVLRLKGPSPGVPTRLAEARRMTTLTAVAGARERRVSERLQQLSRQELEVEQAALPRMSVSRRKELDRELEVVSRADAAVSQLLTLDARLDAEADVRVVALNEVVVDRHRDVTAAHDDLAVVVAKAQYLGGSLAQVMYTRVADHLYDLIVRADVGLIDVVWGLKARRSTAMQAFLTKKNLEQNVLEEELKRQEGALARRFAAETAWAKRLPTVTRSGDH